MKQIRKPFLFSNFSPDISKFTTTNKLTIHSIQNLTLENNIIEPTFNFSSLTDKIIKKSVRDEFYSNNMSVINETLLFEIYEYYETTSSELKQRLFAIRKDLYLYEYDQESNVLVNLQFRFTTLPKVYFKDNCMYFSTKGEDLVCIKDDQMLFFSNIEDIDDFCVHNDFLFFTTSNSKYDVFYIQNTELSKLTKDNPNFSKIHFCEEDGMILKIVFYKSNLYVFQQYKISKLIVDNEKIEVNGCYFMNAKINKNTIIPLKDYIVFGSDCSIFIFDGTDTKSVYTNISKDLKLQNSKAVAFNDKYYLSTQLLYDGNYESVLIELNIQDNSLNIHKTGDIIDLYVIQSPTYYLLCLVDYEDHNYTVSTLDITKLSTRKKYLKFNNVLFNTSLNKQIKCIKFHSYGHFTLTISTEKGSSTFYATDNFEVNNLNIYGHAFTFEIESDSAFFIDSIYVEIVHDDNF